MKKNVRHVVYLVRVTQIEVSLNITRGLYLSYSLQKSSLTYLHDHNVRQQHWVRNHKWTCNQHSVPQSCSTLNVREWMITMCGKGDRRKKERWGIVRHNGIL